MSGKSRKHNRKGPFLAGLTAGALLILGSIVAAAVVFDSRILVNEMNALLEATETFSQVVDDFDDDPRWIDFTEQLEVRRGHFGLTLEDRIWTEYIADVSQAAEEYLRPAQSAILDIEAVSSLPWHSDIAAAREAYLDYAHVQLQKISGRAALTPAIKSIDPPDFLVAQMVTTYVIAERRYCDVWIFRASPDLRTRIAEVFKE